VLIREVQHRTAGDERLHAGRGRQQLGDERPRVEHLLEVVEQQQHLFVVQISHEHVED
jgi:hypothetical protein